MKKWIGECWSSHFYNWQRVTQVIGINLKIMSEDIIMSELQFEFSMTSYSDVLWHFQVPRIQLWKFIFTWKFICIYFCGFYISKKLTKSINHRDNNDDHYKSIFGPGFSSDMAYRPSSTYPGLEWPLIRLMASFYRSNLEREFR